MPRGRRGAKAASVALTVLMGLLPLVALLPAQVAAPDPSVVVLLPAPGAVLSGGMNQTIRWRTSSADENLLITVTYDHDGGGGILFWDEYWYTGTNTATWNVPFADMTNVTLTVCAEDFIGNIGCATSGAFSVDAAPPALASFRPQGSNIPHREPIVIGFSEPMNMTSVASATSISPALEGMSVVPRNETAVEVTYGRLAVGTRYTVTVGCEARDRSSPGLPLADCPRVHEFDTSDWPSVSVIEPTGGEVWSGGSIHGLRWDASDPDEPLSSLEFDLFWYEDGGPWDFVVAGLIGQTSHAWTVPSVDASSVRISVQVHDTTGLPKLATSAPFAIDSTPPSVTGTSPSAAEADVGWEAPILVTFNEAVRPAGAESFGVRDASGRWLAGTIAWDSDRQMRFTPAGPYVDAARYTAQVNATILDLSDPGNLMVATYAWTFETRPNAAPTVVLGDAPSGTVSGGSTWTLTWSASDSEDLAEDLEVFLEFSDGGPFAVVAGPLPASASRAWTAPDSDVAEGTLRVRVVDTRGGTASAVATFAVDATPPSVVAATPPPGAAGVPPSAKIILTFSEPMASSSASAVRLRASDTGIWIPVLRLWTGATTIQLIPAQPLRELVTYEVVVDAGATDQSVPGNPVAPVSWTFRIASFPPNVAILDPAPGARWSGGSTHPVRLAAADALDPQVILTIDLSLDGVRYARVSGPTVVDNGEATFPVYVPWVDADEAVLRACAEDLAGASACETVPVSIDATPPRLVATAPSANARLVRPDASLVLTFSEPMVPDTVERAFSLVPSLPLTFRWTATDADGDTLVVDHPPFQEGRTYTAYLGCAPRDTSSPGLGLAGVCPVAWTFSTASAPQVRMVFPRGGERLSGGTTHEAWWFSWDDEPILRSLVELSLDGGATFAPVSALLTGGPGEVRLAIPLPSVDADRAVVRVAVRDGLDLAAAAHSAPFSIDATPPAILSATPAGGSAGVSPLEDFVFVFTESIDPASVASAVTVWPALRDPIVTWSSTNVPFDTLRISHAAIRLGTSVTVRLEGLRDLSAPGHVFTGSVSFTIAPDRERPTPLIAVAEEATEGDIVVLDATGSTDNDEIASYVWTVRDADGVALANLSGERAEYRTTLAGTLTVSLEIADAAGNTATATAPLRVRAVTSVRGGDGEEVLPPESSLFGLLLLGGAGATAFSITDRGRSWLSRVLVLPLYTKLRPEAILDQETRGMIRGYIRVNPGDSYTDIKRNLGIANGSLAYHLQVLEREGIIKSTTRGARRLYYPADVPIPEDGGGLHEIQERILKNVRETPAMTIRDLAALLGVSSQLALYHLRRLQDMELVRLERHGMRLRVFAATPGEPLRPFRELGDT